MLAVSSYAMECGKDQRIAMGTTSLILLPCEPPRVVCRTSYRSNTFLWAMLGMEPKLGYRGGEDYTVTRVRAL